MKVSVCMITYNHEPFIAKAIEGVLIQKADFDFELVIGEDCSTDNTRAIILEYTNKYPDKVKLLPAQKNLGMMPNFIFTLGACQGEYIALCEGDDYWTDPLKLKKQAAILDALPGCVMVFTNCDTPKGVAIKKRKTGIVPIEEIPVFAPTLTRLFRNVLAKDLLNSDEFFHVKGGDTFLQVYLSSFGDFYYLEDITSFYNIHEGGAWNGKNNYEKEIHVVSTRIACLGLNPRIDKNLIRMIGLKIGYNINHIKFLQTLIPTLVKKMNKEMVWLLLISINKGILDRLRK